MYLGFRYPSDARPIEYYPPAGFVSGNDFDAPASLGDFAGPSPFSRTTYTIEPPAWVASYKVELYLYDPLTKKAMQGVVPTGYTGALTGNSGPIVQDVHGYCAALRLIDVTAGVGVGTDPFTVVQRWEDGQ